LDLLELKAGDKVLEVGAGSGYQAAVLATLVRRVHTVEIIPALVRGVPPALVAQLRPGRRLVIPVGEPGATTGTGYDGKGRAGAGVCAGRAAGAVRAADRRAVRKAGARLHVRAEHAKMRGMKKRYWIWLAASLAVRGVRANAPVPDADRVAAFADAFGGDRFRMAEVASGPFGDPVEDPEFFRLRDGTTLLDEEGVRMAVAAAFQPYRVLMEIKGEMDHWIFVRQARGTSRFPDFRPAAGTQWVVVLREVLDEAGRPLWHDSRLYPGDQAAMPHLRGDNLFMVHRGRGGAVCVGGPEEPEPGLAVHPRQLVEDLRAIQAALAAAAAAGAPLAEEMGLASAFGRAVWQEILDRRKPLTPAERIERDLRDLLQAVEWRELSYADYAARRSEYEAQDWVRQERERQREERERAQAIARAHAELEQGELSPARYEEQMQEWGVPTDEWRTRRPEAAAPP
jgi:hypothetical protein